MDPLKMNWSFMATHVTESWQHRKAEKKKNEDRALDHF